MTLKQWASVTDLKVGTLKQRLAKGWTTEQVLTPNSLRGKGAPEPAA